MSTEIIKQNTAVKEFNFFDAEQFAVMQRVCTMFSNSELVPDMYKVSEKNPQAKAIANCMIAIETAQRIGASPLMVMQNLYIVYGKPSWSAKFLTATVNTCGRFNSIKYRMNSLGKIKNGTFGEVDNWQCVAYTTEKESDEILESIPVTIEMAIMEGWYNRNGSKWKTMAKLMLQYRSVTYWTSAYAPEISMGMKTAEEIYDIEDASYEDVSDNTKSEIKENANKTSLSFEKKEEEILETKKDSVKEAQPAAIPIPEEKKAETKKPDF